MNKKIVIDAGHGGEDPGASGNGIIEKDLNLAISNYMYDRFKELGIPVKITRESDETISPSVRTNEIINSFGNDPNVIVISNHINAGGGEGAEVIYALRNNSRLADLVLNELRDEGQTTRDVYQRRLPSNTSKDYYFIHRDTGNTEPIIVEYGFLDNTNDANRLKNNYQRYAEAVVRAVLDYIGYEGNKYTVVKGDSLYSIARKFNVSVNELKNANNLTSNLLNVGQVLVIPNEEVPISGEYTIYTVKQGDSLYKIANEFNTTVDNLVEYNNLTSTSLSVGQKILIPIIEKEESLYDTYIVKRGDSLYEIANKYNTTVSELININNLDSNLLSIGQRLLVPKSIPIGETTYIVKQGDNLYNIATKYGISVNELKNYNDLKTNDLSIGQTLKIPTAETITYTVKSGDSLYSIARRYNTTVDKIKKDNNLTSNLLSIGQIIII